MTSFKDIADVRKWLESGSLSKPQTKEKTKKDPAVGMEHAKSKPVYVWPQHVIGLSSPCEPSEYDFKNVARWASRACVGDITDVLAHLRTEVGNVAMGITEAETAWRLMAAAESIADGRTTKWGVFDGRIPLAVAEIFFDRYCQLTSDSATRTNG